MIIKMFHKNLLILKKLSGKYEFKIFSEPFEDEADAIEQLSDFEALLIMRETNSYY